VSAGSRSESPVHVFPRREDLIGVAADLARSVDAAHAVLSLDPARFVAGTVGTPGLPRAVVDAVHRLGAPLDTPEEGVVVREFGSSGEHADVAEVLSLAGLTMSVRMPLRGPGGVIGVAELFYDAPLQLGDLELTRLQLHAEHAAMNVVNVRLFNLIERAKKEWESTFDAIRDGISIHDRSCRIRRANWGLGMMLGTTPSLLVGRPCHEAIFGTEKACENCPMQGGRTESFQATEHEAVIDGKAVHVSMYPLILEDGTLSGVVHIVRDISQRKKEEREFHRMHEELVGAHATLQDSMQQLQEAQAQLVQSEKMAAVGQLISGVAHELNNPLTGIIGYSQLLGGQEPEDMDPEKLKRFVKNMGKEALRCQKIVQNLLTFARRNEPEAASTQLNDVVRRTVDLKAYELRVNDVSVELELASRLPETMADGHQLQQVLLNLIHNASQSIQARGGGGTIRVRTEAVERPAGAAPTTPAEWLRLEVEDDGQGFSEEVRERIFDPFFTTKEVGQGTGLGLSICYGIVREHAGQIAAEHAPGGGARIRVLLPVVDPKRAQQGEPVAEAEGPSEVPQGLRVLVVDDEATICDMVRDILVLDGYEVETARNGRDGLAAVESGRYDCILADLKMPEVDGPTLHARLQERDPEAARRMIFMTGDMLGDGSREFLEGTGNLYLAKPFSIQDLRAAVAGTLSAVAD
jgi:two-component system NtrC family sensor kinase